MKDLKKLTGAKILSKMEQKSIKGGVIPCINGRICPYPLVCKNGYCIASEV